jgi:hypothetical protein
LAAREAAKGSHARRAPMYAGVGAAIVTAVVVLLTLRKCV